MLREVAATHVLEDETQVDLARVCKSETIDKGTVDDVDEGVALLDDGVARRPLGNIRHRTAPEVV